LTDLPLIETIRYHVLPDTALPAHVVRHELPVMLEFATTFVPVEMTFRDRAVVEGLVRRLALHRATLVVFPASALPGSETAAMAKTRIADRNEVATRAVSDA
jgi:hypothetical protein